MRNDEGEDTGLTQAEERAAHLAAVVDASSDAIISKTLEGVVTSWNLSAERIFGYTAAEMIGQSIRLLIPDERQDEEDEILAKLRAGVFIEHYETIRLTKDGRRLDVSLSISPVRNSAGVVVGASKIARDISARKQAEEALLAATAKFESVFNQSGMFAGILDPDGNLREVNDLAVDWCGYTRDEVLDRPFWETPWWRGSDEMRERIRTATQQAAAGEVFRQMLSYWVADGTERIVDFALHPIRDERGTVRFLHPTGVDITERIRTEETLRQSEERFRSLVSVITDVTWTAGADGGFCPPQPAWEAYTGQSPDSYRGLGWLDALHPDDRIRVGEEWAAATSAATLFQTTGRLWSAGSGEHRHFFARATPVRRPDGTVGEWVGSCTDVHERTLAEEALRAQEAEEREIAIGLQRALLPERLDAPPGLSFAARYEAGSDALEVGGDWYDVFPLPDGRVALTVGDVVGHGLSAAAAMGQLRTALAALAEHVAAPGELLTLLDGFLARTGTTDFATVCYGVLDPVTGVLEYASAGHLPMLLVTPAGETRLLDRAQSTPLFGDGRQRVQSSVAIEPGALLVLYSDGLVERRGEHLSRGLERLEQAGSRLADASVDEVCNGLVAALGVEATRDDDVAVLAVRLDAVAGPGFHRVFPAGSEQLRELRTAMRVWLDSRGVSVATTNAALLAVGEACANAIEHAYMDGNEGDVAVDITQSHDGSLLVLVRDTGRFRAAPAPGGDRGRGTDIMRALTTDFSRDSTGSGTTVRFRVPVEEPAAA